MTILESVTLIKDITVACAALFGAIIAKNGLYTWRRQLKGQSEYDLSRRILVTLFKYRDALSLVRRPSILNYEMPLPPEDDRKNMSDAQINYYGMLKTYKNRWEKVHKERALLYADLIESEALWGNELKKLFNNIFDLEHELLIRVRHYLDLINPDLEDSSKEAIKEYNKSTRDIMYDYELVCEKEDEYKKDINCAIEKIELYLGPKLIYEEENWLLLPILKSVWSLLGNKFKNLG